LFQTGEIQEALACLTYGVERRRGFVLLTGRWGPADTLLNKLLEGLRGARVATAFIFNPRLSANQFLHFMLGDFGIPCESHMKSQILLVLNQWLLERYRAGETAVLIVDEAQTFPWRFWRRSACSPTWKRLRKSFSRSCFQVSPNSRTSLTRPRFASFATDHAAMPDGAFVSGRDPGYISERLRIAGADGEPLFNSDAIEGVSGIHAEFHA